MTADPEAVTRALAVEPYILADSICRRIHPATRDDMTGFLIGKDGPFYASCAFCKDVARQVAPEVASVLASLPDDRLAEAEKDANGPGWFWTRTEWSEWSNELALLIPEKYDDDVAQEAIISRAVADMVKRLAEAEAKLRRVEEFCSALEAEDDYVRSWKCARQLRAALSGDTGPTGGE